MRHVVLYDIMFRRRTSASCQQNPLQVNADGMNENEPDYCSMFEKASNRGGGLIGFACNVESFLLLPRGKNTISKCNNAVYSIT